MKEKVKMTLATEQQQEETAFQAGFASANGSEAPAPVAEAKPEVVEEKQDTPEAQAPSTTEEDVPDLTPSEIRALLSRVTEIDDLKKQVRQAHGKIGELNGTLLEFRRAPAQAAPEVPDIDPAIASYIESRLPQQQQEERQAPAQQPAPNVSLDLQEQLMDHLHEGWREKLTSQDYNLWLAAQPDETRQLHDTAATAKELNGLLVKFDAWTEARKSRQSNGKQRLEQNLTPTGNPGKPKTAPSEDDAFRAAFNATIAR